MSENCTNSNGFKEAVCIEVQRIFDSCSDRDCLENLELIFDVPAAYQAIECAAFVKTRCVEVVSTFFSIEPVPFNKGFFSVDITYTFNAEVEVYQSTCTSPSVFTGHTTFNKKVLLYGSDGNTKYFSSTDECGATQINGCCSCFTNLPKASVSVVEPICLDCKIVCKRPCTPKHDCVCGVSYECCPPVLANDGQAETKAPPRSQKTVVITIGMFSIVSLSRAVPLLIPAYDYCVPQKECSNSSDSPCELFDKISFPTDEFFPRSLNDCSHSYGCDCSSSCCDTTSPSCD